MPRPRLLRWTIAVACVAVALGGVASRPAAATPDGMVWGAYVATQGTEDDQEATLRFEQDSGRKLGVVRDFLLWDAPFPEPFHDWLADTDRTMILSVRALLGNGNVVPWAAIAAAQPGSALYNQIASWADRMQSLGVPLYFSFNHEPETVTNQPMGIDSEFIAAFRKFHDVFAARGATNVKFMWIMTDYSFFVGSQDRRDASKWYPGDAYVDAIAADAYNWFTCRPAFPIAWKSLETIIEPFRDFGAAHPGKEVWLAEWGTVEDPDQPGRKGEWITEAQALFKRPDYGQFVGVSYFDSYRNADCPWPIETSASSQSAFSAMGQDAFYSGPSVPQPTISFVAAANRHGNRLSHDIVTPSAVRAGDTLLLYYTSALGPATTTPPAGWSQVRAVNVNGLRSRVWTRTATAADAGRTVTVTSSETNKADLTISAYRSADGSAIDVSAVAYQTTTATQHIAPSVTPTRPGDWVVAYWADRSASNTGHTIPAVLTRRLTSSGSGTGHLTATVADSAAAVPQAPTPTYRAIGAAQASRAVMYTIALRAP